MGTRAAGECFHRLDYQPLFREMSLRSSPKSLFGEERRPDPREQRKSSLVFPQLFRVLPNFHECLYDSIETRRTCQSKYIPFSLEAKSRWNSKHISLWKWSQKRLLESYVRRGNSKKEKRWSSFHDSAVKLHGKRYYCTRFQDLEDWVMFYKSMNQSLTTSLK